MESVFRSCEEIKNSINKIEIEIDKLQSKWWTSKAEVETAFIEAELDRLYYERNKLRSDLNALYHNKCK